jgi:enoyl-CoA hydratase/carnithine racemase
MTSDVHYERHLGLGGEVVHVILNRTKALNALTHEMITSLYENLTAFEKDEQVKAVYVTSRSEKAFCAGGDVRSLYEKGRAQEKDLFDFFKDEYRLNELTFRYKKPYVCFLDGITMGGGVGLSFHGLFPVLTPRTKFAMPETSIGFCPDVGGAYLLNKINHQVGLYLALTGQTISGSDALYFGLSPFYVESEKKEELLKHLCELDMGENAFDAVTSLLNAHFFPPEQSAYREHLECIQHCFTANNVETIFEKLSHMATTFSEKTHITLNQKSPTALKVVYKQLNRTREMTLQECLALDYQLVQAFLQDADFYEGVRALLVDKDHNPQWLPPSLALVSDEMVENYFKPQALSLTF